MAQGRPDHLTDHYALLDRLPVKLGLRPGGSGRKPVYDVHFQRGGRLRFRDQLANLRKHREHRCGIAFQISVGRCNQATLVIGASLNPPQTP